MELNFIGAYKKLKFKKVLLRVDFNVPTSGEKIVSDYKIQKSLNTIKYLLKQGASIIIVSHLGRPKKIEQKLSLLPIVQRLEKLLNKKCFFIDIQKLKHNWEDVQEYINGLPEKSIVVLENIRFFKEEEQNSKIFAKKLAELADIFVLDGFGVAHRKTASVSGVAEFLPAYGGFLFNEEVQGMMQVLDKPKRPLVVVIGGIKMETKIPMIKKFLSIADQILLGGGLASTYLWSQGKKIGNSFIDKKFKKELQILSKSKKIIFPVDVVVGKKNGDNTKVIEINLFQSISNELGIYDMGPRTTALYQKYISKAATIVWNGALGFFEQRPYHKSTFAIARSIAKRSKGRTFSVCGGGETEEILRKLNLIQNIDLVSTGGGAMLEFLSGQKLPGVKAVEFNT